MKYALVFLALSLACALDAATASPWLLRVALVSCALAFGGVGFAYAFISPRAFFKRADGGLPALSYLVYAPYHALNALSLWVFRRSSRENDWDEIAPNVYLGCRLSARDQAEIETLRIARVLDLTSEFAETPFLRALDYCCIPLLDTHAPTLTQLRAGANWIAQSDDPIYVHCALGHGRSATFVAAYLLLSKRAQSAADAVSQIQKLRPRIGLSREQMAVLRCLES